MFALPAQPVFYLNAFYASFNQSFHSELTSFQIYFSLHSYGEKVMYPWSYTNQKLPDWQELHSVGIVIADAIEAIAGLPYWVRNIVS